MLSREAELVAGPGSDVKGASPRFSQLQSDEMGNMRMFSLTPHCMVIHPWLGVKHVDVQSLSVPV